MPLETETSGEAVRRIVAAGAGLAAGLAFAVSSTGFAAPPPQQGAQPALVRQLGTIKQIQGNTIKLTPDEGGDITVVVKQGARMLRVEPGEKDLSHAVTLDLGDLQAGDRIRVRGQNAPDGKSLVALEVIAIKHLDIQAKQERERADWQKRGIGGLVTAVDAAANTVVVSVRAQGATKTVTLHVTAHTLLRRYAPGSVKFDEAKAAPLSEIRAGDQLRARGNRSEDGNDLNAEEIVSGSFRNIAGTINSIDADAKSMVISDLLSKKTVTVQVSAQSQLRKLPPQLAQMLAMGLRGGAGGGPGAPGGAPGNPGGAAGTAPGGAAGDATARPRGDFQQLVNRLPQVTLADLQKGDAVILVATESGESGPVTAITLLGGVEPLLTASARATQAFTLSPWALGGGGGEGGEPNQ